MEGALTGLLCFHLFGFKDSSRDQSVEELVQLIQGWIIDQDVRNDEPKKILRLVNSYMSNESASKLLLDGWTIHDQSVWPQRFAHYSILDLGVTDIKNIPIGNFNEVIIRNYKDDLPIERTLQRSPTYYIDLSTVLDLSWLRYSSWIKPLPSLQEPTVFKIFPGEEK